jgi:acyl transferase domain-containing protein/NAD(P)-dependent dehydrogenase (short-subunit alcohol dehydrogenase family)
MAHSPAQLWRSLCSAQSGIGEVPDTRYNSQDAFDPRPGTPGKLYTTTAGLVNDAARFDASFFGVSGREAEKLDPQARILLNVTWEALQDANLVPEDLKGSETGVYVGSLYAEYERAFLLNPASYDVYAWAGSTMRSGLAGRVSSAFDFRGPSMMVDTACSSSLAALHLACRALQTSDCSLAIAGGSNLLVDPVYTMGYSSASMLAPNGQAKPFCEDADGTVRSDGVAVVVLKVLEEAIADGDEIYAVVRGGAINHGGASSPYMQPSQEGQAQLIRRALDDARVEPGQIQYVEAHGTGTRVGDPIELSSIANALCDGRNGNEPLLVGSLKGNIGHTEGAAGIAGVIKVALALRHRRLPPSINATPVTPSFAWDQWPLEVCTQLREWPLPQAELLAGVSAFGVTGINAHVVLAEAPPDPASTPRDESQEDSPAQPYLLTVSGHSAASLEAAAANFVSHPFADDESLENICRSAAERSIHFSHRLAALVESKEDIAAVLSEHLEDVDGSPLDTGIAADDSRPLVFVFSGQGSQSPGMGLELFANEPVFASAIEQWDELAKQYLDWSIIDELRATADTSRLDGIDVIQPMLAAMQFGLATLWESWGVVPDAVVGHSLGEVTAAQTAGAITLADAVRIICQRAKVLHTATGLGSMIATELTFDEAQEYVARHPDRLSAACSNGPKSTVLSGETALLDEIYAELEGQSSFVRRVKVNVPAHSALLDPLYQPCLDAIGVVEPGAIRRPFYSSVDSTAAAETLSLDHEYWWRNMRNPVLFSQAIGRLAENGYKTFVEVSPHPVLTVPVMQRLRHGSHEGLVLPTLKRGESERSTMLLSMGRLFCSGAVNRMDAVFPGATKPARLPPHGWSGEHYWHAADAGTVSAGGNGNREHPMVEGTFRSALVPKAQHHDLAINLNDQPFLRDHQVGGQVMFPATGYLEAALACAVTGPGAASLEEAFSVRDVEFTQALGLSEEVEQTAQIALHPRGRDLGFAFEVFSRRANASPSTPWTGHASGILNTAPLSSAPTWPPLPEPNPIDLDSALHYASVQRRDVRYGADFQTIEKAWRLGPGEVLARLGDGLGDPKYHLDPTLLDGALQTLYLAIQSQSVADRDRLLPARILEIFVIRDRRPRWVKTSATRTEDGSTATANMWLYDDEGRPSVMMREVVFQRVERANAATELVYSQRWQPLSASEPPAAGGAEGGNGSNGGGDAHPSSTPNRWLVLGDEGLVAETWLARWVRDNPEHRCLLVSRSDRGGGIDSPNIVEWGGPLAKDADAIVARCAQMCGPEDTLGVLHLSCLDSQFDGTSDGSAERLESIRDAQVMGIVRLTQALDMQSDSLPPELQTWVVTSNAMAVTSSQPSIHVGQAPAWGLVPSLRVEHPRFNAVLVDLDGDDSPDQCASRLVEVITSPSVGEDRLAFREGQRWAPRLQRTAEDGPALQLKASSVDHATPFRVGMPQPGILERLRLQGARRTRPEAGEVEIHVHASGLNFHDVFVAMGILAPDNGGLEDSLGLECAGVVSALGEGVTHLEIGQPVVAVARGCLGSYAVTEAHLACPKPPGLSFDEAASIPLTFLTAHYALNEHARLERGESVLIHAGSGGVGFAAIQLAQGMGARILSTASEAKQDYVRDLGVDEVYDSRSLDFADKVLATTGHKGVDVVLNSLAGEFQRKSLEVLAPYGRFVEIGKADLVSDGQLELKHFEDNRSFVAVDIARRCQDRPREVGQRLADLMRRFGTGDLRVSPIERFPLDKVADAFTYMAKARHRGKIVLTVDPSSNAVHLGETQTEIRGDGTYVIVGGGGIGGALIEWLLARGARHIAVISRNPRSNPDRSECVTQVRGDVTDAKELEEAFARIQREMPPIAGVVHSAGSTDDAAIVKLTEAQVSAVCRAKMEGLYNLHRAVADLSLDFLLLCSSATWFLGSHGQANYGAANAFVEATAQAWRRQGIPATVIHFGPWAEVGIIARAGTALAGRLVDRGFAPMMPRQAVAASEHLLRRDVTSAAVMDFEAEKWLTGVRVSDRSRFYDDLLAEAEARAPASAADDESGTLIDLLGSDEDRIKALEGFLVEQLRRCLRLPVSKAPDPVVPMRRFGLDSLMALELSLRIEEAVDQPIAAGVLLEDGMSISRLAANLSDTLGAAG